VPAPADVAMRSRRPAPVDDGLREALLARVRSAAASAWACQDAELDAEIAALEASGSCTVPAVAELAGLAPDPYAGPPEGTWGWLADLPGPLLDEYLAATAEPPGPHQLAGLWAHTGRDGCGFAAGGVADELAPGVVLAGLAGDMAAAGLGRCSDDELIGLLRAGRRLASWSAWLELSAVGELMERRLAQEAAGHAHVAEHADAEIAAALTLTGRAGGRLLDQAMALARLPLTARALAAGAIDVPRAMVIADELSGLDDGHAAAVEQRLLTRAAGQTTSQLRAAARRAVLAADPAAARARQEEAQRDARVERWAEHAGTAALAGRDLPPAGALAADQHLSELARSLRAAGLAGTMDELRAQVFLALLAGQPVASLLPPGAPASGEPCASAGLPGSPAGPPLAGTANPGLPGGPAVTGSINPGLPGSPAVTGSINPGLADSPVVTGSINPGLPGSPVVTGSINLTVPLRTWLGWSESPGEVAGFGPLSGEDCRRLGEGMAADPRTRWCLTVTDRHGHPVAHGCARRGRGLPGPLGGGAGPPGGLAGVRLEWLQTSACSHRRESGGYRPPESLQHLIRVRHRNCAFPGCGRPACRCDLDHTAPYHLGGRTCECNLAPLCRRHHEAKQAHGWRLEQPRPGVLTWTTPSGRTYTTHAAVYPV
jgi:hypothetical protein